jgi:predicted nucleic acid-binding protein
VTGFIDSNVLIDVFTADPAWGRWSERSIIDLGDRPKINGIVYAEIAVRFGSRESLDSELAALEVDLIEPGLSALFSAGKAFAAYRDRGGSRTAILPDFIIGAHATSLGLPLVTRDPCRYRTYFPDLSLVTPDA